MRRQGRGIVDREEARMRAGLLAVHIDVGENERHADHRAGCRSGPRRTLGFHHRRQLQIGPADPKSSNPRRHKSGEDQN